MATPTKFIMNVNANATNSDKKCHTWTIRRTAIVNAVSKNLVEICRDAQILDAAVN